MVHSLHIAEEVHGKTRSLLTGLKIALFSCSLAMLLGCGGGSGGGGGNQTFHIQLSPTLQAIAVGGTKQFSASTVDNTTGNPVSISGLTYSWTSSNTSVATINGSTGLATALGAGSTTITVLATNTSGGSPGFDITTLTVSPVLAMNSGPLPLGALTNPYPTTGLASGGAAPKTFSLLNGTTLPAGLTLNSNGTITGTPTVAGVSSNFMVQVVDSETPPVSMQATFSITTVDPANPCNILTNSNPGILYGSYAFLLQGFQATTANGTPVAMAGSFAANGSGGITGGEVDLNVAAGPQHLTINGGVYAISASGAGCLQLKYTNSTSTVFHFALSQLLNASNVATHGRIIEFDGYQGAQGGSATNLASGILRLQNPTEFSNSSLATRYAFGNDGFDMAGKHVAIGGTFNFNTTNGNITNFAEDVDDGGTISTFTGATGTASSTSTTATTGRETVVLTLPGPVTAHLATYVLNTNEMLLISTDVLSTSFPIYSGRAIVTGSSYTASSLSGNYIYRAEGVDYQGDGVTCAASGPCAVTDLATLIANAGTGALTGTQYQLQAGATQTTTISNTTYSINVSTGRVQLSPPGGGKLPVYYLAAPVASGTDATESINAFVVGSGPTLNSSSGDPTALFGFIEAQPIGPYVLNSPPPYVLASEDQGQITGVDIVGIGNFSSGAITLNRDTSSTAGLVFNGPTSFAFTLNADGTMGGTGAAGGPGGALAGVTNSTAASPGKALAIVTTNAVAGIRLFEP